MHAAASGMSAQIDLTTQCPLSRGGLGLRGKAPLSAGRQAKGCLQPSFFLAGGEAGGESGKKIYCYWGPSEPPGSLGGDREAGSTSGAEAHFLGSFLLGNIWQVSLGPCLWAWDTGWQVSVPPVSLWERCRSLSPRGPPLPSLPQSPGEELWGAAEADRSWLAVPSTCGSEPSAWSPGL